MKKLLFLALMTLVIIAAFSVMISAENLINQDFASTTGDLNWAFFETAGTLEYNETEYTAGTLVIYGTGTEYTFSKGIQYNDVSGYPWHSVRANITKIVFDTPNLNKIQTFSYLGSFSEIYLPAGVNSLSDYLFLGCYKLHTVKIAGVDYSSYGDSYIYDLRGINTVCANTFGNTARDISESEITVLLGAETKQTGNIASSRFADASGSTFTFVAYKDTDGETWAKGLIENAASSTKIADKINLEYYPEPMKGAISFDGYQVRTTKYNGLRGLFSFDKTVVNEGKSCIEYGAILSTLHNKELYGTELSLNNGEYVTAASKIVKLPVMENGVFTGKTLSNDDQKTSFATTIVRFTSDWKTPVYMCGYEIWQDSNGNTEIVYTDSYADGELYTPTIYDVVLESFANGLVNASDEDEEKVLWGILNNCRNEITAVPETYTLENNVIKHTSSDINIHTFTRSDSTTVAIVTGTNDARDITKMLNDVGVDAPVVVLDHGFTAIGNACFEWNGTIKTLVYPKSVKSIGNSCFQGAKALRTVFCAHTKPLEGTVDLSHMETVALNWLFNGDKPYIEYIHLPTNFGDSVTKVPSQAFRKCTALKAVWCGDNERIDGTANFSGTSITSATGDGTANDDSFYSVPGITNFIWG